MRFGILLEFCWNFVAGSSCGLAIFLSIFRAEKKQGFFWTRDSGSKVLGLDPLPPVPSTAEVPTIELDGISELNMEILSLTSEPMMRF